MDNQLIVTTTCGQAGALRYSISLQLVMVGVALYAATGAGSGCQNSLVLDHYLMPEEGYLDRYLILDP